MCFVDASLAIALPTSHALAYWGHFFCNHCYHLLKIKVKTRSFIQRIKMSGQTNNKYEQNVLKLITCRFSHVFLNTVKVKWLCPIKRDDHCLHVISLSTPRLSIIATRMEIRSHFKANCIYSIMCYISNSKENYL